MFGYTTYFILKTIFGPQRAADFRLRARHRKSRITKDLICLCVAIGILVGAVLHGLTTDYNGSELVHEAQAQTVVGAEMPLPREVRIEAHINWTSERIEKEIRNTFPEDPETAVKIARCESGLVADIQSRHVLSYGQEKSWGVFQIHEPDWGKTAVKLGYKNYKTDPADNIAMARHIYDNAGKKWTDWTCYNKRMI